LHRRDLPSGRGRQAGKPASYDDIIRELGKSESVTFQGVNADYQVTFTR
jgi:hypothetical protein